MKTQLSFFLGLVCLCSGLVAQNNALHFDGDDDYVVVADNSLLNVGTLPGFSVLASIKTANNNPIPNFTGIVAKANPGANLGYQLLVYNNRIAAEVTGAGGGVVGPLAGLLGTTPLNDSTWHHVALTVDRTAGTAQLYVDGRLEKSITNSDLTRNLDNPAPLLIGVERTYALNFGGAIDQVSLWGRSLPAEEIPRASQAQLNGQEYKVRSAFDFNNGYPSFQHFPCGGWCDASKKLINRVPAAGDGVLTNFAMQGSSSNWVASGRAVQPLLSPVFRLTAADGKGWLYTMSRQEAEDRLQDRTFRDMTVAYYAFSSAATGTVPLDRFFAKDQTGDHFYTTNQQERSVVVSNNYYTYEGVMGYVVPRTAAGTVPLFRTFNPSSGLHFYSTTRSEIDQRLATGYKDEGIAAYVFPSIDASWNPQAFRVYAGIPQVSEDIWYTIVSRPYRDNHGLFMTPQNTVDMREIPRTGDYAAFQWRVIPNTGAPGTYWIVNRQYPGRALDCHMTAGPTVGQQGAYTGQRWTLTALPQSGTDTYSLSNLYITASKSIAYRNGQFSTQPTSSADPSQAFTLVAMELNDGYFIPGLSAVDQAFPYNKKLVTSQGVEIIGTGTTSEWAVLRAWVIYENMITNVQDQYSRGNLRGKKVVVISKDDKNLDTSRYPIIMPTQSMAEIATYRGICVTFGPPSYAYITEEMMCKTGVVNRPSDTAYRRWDQLTHEFGHLLDMQMGLNGGGTPPCALNNPLECFAASVSAWYNTNLTYPQITDARTRAELQTNHRALYDYIAARFKVQNAWQPPAQLRDRY